MTSSTARYLDALYGRATGFVELRYRLRSGGFGREFHAVSKRAVVERRILTIGGRTDLYVGVLARRTKAGGRAAIDGGHVVWLDLDSPAAVARVRRLPIEPNIVISTGRGQHAYWLLAERADVPAIEQANRRLAHATGGDRRATDAARILRPPQTVNFKHGARVTVERLDAAPVRLAAVVADLSDPPRSPARLRDERGRHLPATLGAIPASAYVPALLHRRLGRDGKLTCPFHADRVPSLHAYDDATRGWYCFGCGRGGTIIDFGAHLYAIEPRGAGYWTIRERLAADLGVVTP